MKNNTNKQVKKILIIGQCTLHWGRMEYGNIGNYYIIEPFVRELHEVFPGAEIRTTFQMSEDFCEKEKVTKLPMEYYYSWTDSDLDRCLIEYALAEIYNKTGFLPKTTPFINEVLEADLVIDFSGDIWGDNANLLGPNRFLIGAYKDLIVNLLGKPIVMLAGSPGPFEEDKNLEIAKEVFEKFDLVTNREPVSHEVLKKYGVKSDKLVSLACPAFLFEPKTDDYMVDIYKQENLYEKQEPVIGFIICGWNFVEGPFDKWPREDHDYEFFAELVEYLEETTQARICLMSHSNGFELPPHFKLIQGRDYPVIKQLQAVLAKRGKTKKVFAIDGLYSPAETKALIRKFDMLVSGRVHAAVAGLSQSVPTVILDYGHEPKAHKLQGFAEVAGVREYVADPADLNDMKVKVKKCWENRLTLTEFLNKKIPQVKELARENFRILPSVVEKHSS